MAGDFAGSASRISLFISILNIRAVVKIVRVIEDIRTAL